MPLSRRVRTTILAALAVAASALLLAACGGGGSSEDATKLVRETFTGQHDIKSGKLSANVNLDIQGSGSQGPVALNLGGPFQSRGQGQVPQFDLTAKVQAQGRTFDVGAISTGTQGYVVFQGQAYALPPAVFQRFVQGFRQAQARQQGKPRTTLAALGINPENWLKDPKVEGDETVGGAQTTHISSGVDTGKLLSDLSNISAKASSLGVKQANRFSGQALQQAKDQIKDVKVDVWTGKDDKTWRKISVSLTVEPKTGQVKSAKLAFTVEIDDLNQPQTINAPANAKPLSDLTSALGGLGLGGLGAGSSSGSSGGSAPSLPSGGSTERYRQCIQQSGGNITKIQQCAPLLNG